jgi:hypothetical protein
LALLSISAFQVVMAGQFNDLPDWRHLSTYHRSGSRAHGIH